MGFRLDSIQLGRLAAVNRTIRQIIIAILTVSAAVVPASLGAQAPPAQPKQDAPKVPETKAPSQGPLKHPDNDYWRKHDQL